MQRRQLVRKEARAGRAQRQRDAAGQLDGGRRAARLEHAAQALRRVMEVRLEARRVAALEAGLVQGLKRGVRVGCGHRGQRVHQLLRGRGAVAAVQDARAQGLAFRQRRRQRVERAVIRRDAREVEDHDRLRPVKHASLHDRADLLRALPIERLGRQEARQRGGQARGRGGAAQVDGAGACQVPARAVVHQHVAGGGDGRAGGQKQRQLRRDARHHGEELRRSPPAEAQTREALLDKIGRAHV